MLFLEVLSTCKSICSSWCKNYVILSHQMPTLLFYHIILQHLIYQMFYNSILKIHYFGLPHLSVPLQICNGTDTKWYMCQIYATYATSVRELFFVFGVGALSLVNNFLSTSVSPC